MPELNAETSRTTSDCSRRCWNFAGDPAPPAGPCVDVVCRITRRSASGNVIGRSSTALTTEKIAVLAPMPRASADTAAAVKARLCQNIRSDCFRSLMKASMVNCRLKMRLLERGIADCELDEGIRRFVERRIAGSAGADRGY